MPKTTTCILQRQMLGIFPAHGTYLMNTLSIVALKEKEVSIYHLTPCHISVQTLTTSFYPLAVAMENVKEVYLVPGSNASYPMGGDTLWNSIAQPELSKIILTVMARSPISQTTKKDPKNTQIEIMCMKAVVVDPPRDQFTPPPTPSDNSVVPTHKPNAAASGFANPGFVDILLLGLFGLLLMLA